ncbi:MAG: type III toxin-antitoxin system ToxN/AbiQ family toxin [Clostridiales bacterium]|nr:type III toxin-antitoxin system ToxN/AbiQ family toxin [Clostridiales bacterium]
METIALYEIDPEYIDYLSQFEERLFKNKKISQSFTRKYVGVVLSINGFDYFAPLSSFKPKHKRLCETVDFLKIGTYAVINLNNMLPAPISLCTKVIIDAIQDERYKSLVRAEYRIIRQKSALILANAKSVYDHKILNDGKSKLSRRCNDFRLLEEKCKDYI